MPHRNIKAQMHDKGYASFDKLAEALIARTPKLSGLPPMRTLSAYIGKLAKGDDTWFRRRGPEASALAALLGMALDELLPPAAQGQKLWHFEEFPQLPALDLEREDPSDVFKPANRSGSSFAGWLPKDSGLWHIAFDLCYHTNDPAWHEPRWISAPPGAGKRLLSRWAEAKNWAGYLEVGRLSEAVGVARPGPDGRRILVLVAESDPDGDRQALLALAQAKPITVLAPFQFPHPALEDDTPRQPKAWDGSEQIAGWTIKQWKLADDWRRRLLEWVGKRLNQGTSQFKPGPLLEWLDKHDPQAMLLPTPGDLLPICALAHKYGELWLAGKTSEQLSALLLDSLTERLPEDADGRLWLTSRATKLLEQLLTKRLSDLTTPLRGGSPPQVWASYLDETELKPPPSEQGMRASLTKLRGLKGELRQRMEATLVRRVTTPDAIGAIWLLKRAGVLRTDRTGGLAAYPRWSQECCLNKAAQDGIRPGAAAAWGRWAVGYERRQLLDDAIDALRPPALLEHIKIALADFDPGQLGCVGAIESLFAAVARLLVSSRWRPKDPSTVAQLHALWLRAESLRAPTSHRPGSLRCPRTRVEDYLNYADDFVASCWAWSFWLPAPEPCPTQDPPWLWPGWGTVSLRDIADLPLGHRGPSWAEQGREHSVGTDRMFFLLDEFLKRCSDTALQPRLPSLFVVNTVVYAALHGWAMDPAVNLWWHSWHTEAFIAKVPALSRDGRRRIADWHVGLLMAGQGGTFGGVLAQLAVNDPRLHQFLLVNADWSKVREHLAKFNVQALISDLPRLPEPLQQWAVQNVAARKDLDVETLTRAITEYTNAPPPELRVQLLVAIAEAREDCGHTLPRRLFELSHEQALQAAERSWWKNPASEQSFRWFVSSPKSMSARKPLIALIKALSPQQRPSWAGPFLSSMLHHAGEHTDELFRLIQSCE